MVHFIVITLLSLLGTSTSTSLTNDALVLASLKQGFEFSDSALHSWNVANLNSVCSWDGIGCADRRVVEVLDAYNNNFTALLPLGILHLEKIKYLDLAGNFFFGNIPAVYGKLTGLEYLSLAGNDLHGKIPGELGNLTNLKELYLGYYNVFEGGIPKEFGNLASLNHLDMSSCELDGQIPHQLGNLKLLDTLFLHANLLSGSIPKQLGSLTSLVNLDLSYNALTGEVPFEFINLKRLSLLNLFMNRLHGSIPDFIADLPNLEVLGMWMNNFTGVIPEKLGLNGKLEVLDLSSNKLTGMIPRGLCSSNQLRILILQKNFLFGPIPEGLGACLSLTRVRLGENYLNGSIPSGFLYLPLLNLAELHNNYLSGILMENSNSNVNPAKLGQMNLSNNLISGSLPSSISNFSSLQILLLSGNQFSGPIPPSIGELHQLLKLDLSRNTLSYEIPAEIGNCSHLAYLDLSQNNLSGAIPSEVSNIRILNYLNLSRNHLNHTIPKSIGFMKSLTVADFSFNDLSGKLPESGQFSYFNASSYAGNPHLCGSLLNNPCNFTTVTTKPNKVPRDFKLIFALGLLLCSLVFAAAAIIKSRSFKKSGPHSWKMTAFRKVEFNVSDVLECLKDCNVIGRGGAGVVYVGKMPSGEEIAVKKLLGFGNNNHDHGFQAEILTLGKIRHRNILLNFVLCENAEYAYTLKVDEKSDVYSFGVVLLELITGRRPVGDFGDGVDIVQWAKRITNCSKEEVISIIDPRLIPVPMDETMHLFFVAMLCIQENSIERPTMREVVQMLSEFPREASQQPSPSSSTSTPDQVAKNLDKKDLHKIKSLNLLI
ncbi:hypothetical protein IFM89_009908 [Coptis chinensis]|uniref:Protein kinase domain-containing protein n=1 Tax=Coptis chinensis TaxID=261450 RepID=A0A835LXE2_9MAGN|nr:hypothetical protein IFM89_009908 [Coptis chinensis]